jgi:hypothetical protein
MVGMDAPVASRHRVSFRKTDRGWRADTRA